jgi:hypothetical protein
VTVPRSYVGLRNEEWNEIEIVLDANIMRTYLNDGGHNDDYLDPDVYGPPVLYWYKTVRDPKEPGGAKLVPNLIHNSSGAGSDVLAMDLNGDGIMDIVTATKRGLYIFWGKADAPTPAK